MAEWSNAMYMSCLPHYRPVEPQRRASLENRLPARPSQRRAPKPRPVPCSPLPPNAAILDILLRSPQHPSTSLTPTASHGPQALARRSFASPPVLQWPPRGTTHERLHNIENATYTPTQRPTPSAPSNVHPPTLHLTPAPELGAPPPPLASSGVMEARFVSRSLVPLLLGIGPASCCSSSSPTERRAKPTAGGSKRKAE